MAFDFIVVGGGTAGCVTAYRLVKNHGARVLLLEAGPRDDGLLFRMPVGFTKLLKGKTFVRRYETPPQPSLGDRKLHILQARVLGGGSSINGMSYFRGRPSDYQDWDTATGGNAGWGWQAMLAHFIRLEANQRLHGATHGIDGPMKVSGPRYVCEASHAFLDTMQALGIPLSPDFNSGNQFGVSFVQANTYKGERWSASRAFIRPIENDPRFTLLTQATVSRILFNGHRATGVEYLHDGKLETARADNEIVLTTGAYVSPQLLMLSGIGPAQHLRQHGVDVRVDLPGVGQNMQDHNGLTIAAYTRGAYGYYGQDRPLKMLSAGLRYLLFRRGPSTSVIGECCAFLNPQSAEAEPTIQIYCIGVAVRDIATPLAGHGISLVANLIRPKSRGHLQLRSSDPADSVAINPNYLSHPDDLSALVSSVHYLRQVLATPPLKQMIKAEVFPGPEVGSHEQIVEFCKKTTKPDFHPVGSCRMGVDSDPTAVLTPDLRVRGIDGLRVFDASAMPSIVSANPNGVVMAIAEKGVAMMTARSA